MALGGLVVKLALEHASYSQGLDKSSQDALKFAKNAQDAMDRAKRATSDFLGGVVSGAVAAVASYQSIEAVISDVSRAIDRLDEISKTAQRVGIASEQLQELAHAGELADVGLEALATSSKKLSQAMLEAATGGKEQAAVFKAIGVEVKNADGSLRASNDVMADVADVFAGLEDGATKTALAVKLFGKAGADMIPLLNGGKQALAEAKEEAHKFGLVLGEETLKNAEAFNDNITRLGKITQGVFNQIASGTLPVLVSFSEALVDAASDVDSVNAASQRLAKDGSIFNWAKSAAIGLTYVMDAGEGVWRVLKGLGQLVGGLAAAAANNIGALASAFLKLQRGDFSGAFDALKAGVSGLGAIVSSVGEDLAATFGDQLMGHKIRDRIQDLKAFGNTTAQAGQKTRDVNAIISALGENDGAKKAADKMKTLLKEAQALADLRNKENEGIDAYLRAEEGWRQQAARSAEEAALHAEMELQNRGLLKSQIEETVLARLEERKATLAQGSAAAESVQREIDARQRVIEAMRKGEALDAKEAAQKAAQDQAKAAYDEWSKMNDRIGQSLADALMEGGRSARDYLKGLFRNLVLQPIIKAVVDPISGVISALLTGVSASGGGGGGGIGGAAAGLNNLSTLSTVYSAATGYSSGVNALAGYLGAGSTAGASGLSLGYANAVGAAGGDSLGALIAANNSWSGVAATEGAAASAGAGAGAAAWTAYAAAFVAAYMGSRSAWEKGFNNENLTGAFRYSPESTFTDLLKLGGMSDRAANIWGGGAVYTSLFGRASPRVESQGIMGSISGGNFTGQAYADILEKGGLFRSDKRYTETAAIADDLAKMLDDASAAVLKHAKEFGAALGLPAEQLANITTEIKVALTGDFEKDKAELTKVLGQYGDALVNSFAEQVKPFAEYGETAAQTIERLGGALIGVNQAISQLGLDQLEKTLAGGAAAFDLTQLFGNVDQFQQALGQFYTQFTSDAQRTQDLAVHLGKAFSDLGVTMPSVTDGVDAAHESYKELLRAQDLTTESGRQTFAALVGLSGAFDTLAQASSAAAEAEAERAAEIAADLAEKAARAADQSQSLQVELLRATGQELQAVALERQIELAQLRELEVSLNVASGAFTDVQEAIYAAADAAAVAAREQRLLASADAVAADFLKGNELAQYYSDRINQTLSAGGLGGSTLDEMINATREDILELWRAVGIDGKEAIFEALPMWEELQAVIRDLEIAELVDGLASSADELIAAYREIVPEADTLVESWRKNKTAMQELQDALDELAGTSTVSAVEQLRKDISARDALRNVIEANADTILDLQVGQGGQQAVDLLKAREAELRTRFSATGSAADAQELTRVILRRIQVEGQEEAKNLKAAAEGKYQAELKAYELQKQANEEKKASYQEEISAAKRIQELAKSIPETLGALRAGSLSNLSYSGRLEQQRGLFERSLETGIDPQGQLTAYLQQAQQMYGGATAEYSAIFTAALAQYEASITEAAAKAPADIALLEAQVASLDALAPKLSEVMVDVSGRQIEALGSLQDLLKGKENGMTVAIDEQTATLKAELQRLQKVVENQEAQITQAGAAATAIIEGQREIVLRIERLGGIRDLDEVMTA